MLAKKFIRTFLISLSMTFLMVIIPHLGFKSAWVSPLPKTQDIFLQKIQPKLEARQNIFLLQKQLIQSVAAGSDFEQASAYAVADFNTGQIIISKNLSKRLPFASLTKIMTAIVALDLSKADEEFTVSDTAAAEPSTKVMLKPGEKYKLENLLKFMLISSANDSAEVVKEGEDAKFGQEVFVKAMNLKAQILGLKNTHFTNSIGLDDDNHFSTAEDLTILSGYALKEYPEIAGIVSEASEDLT